MGGGFGIFTGRGREGQGGTGRKNRAEEKERGITARTRRGEEKTTEEEEEEEKEEDRE